MEKIEVLGRSLEKVLSAANAAYNKNKEEYPNLYQESARVHFVKGWIYPPVNWVAFSVDWNTKMAVMYADPSDFLAFNS